MILVIKNKEMAILNDKIIALKNNKNIEDKIEEHNELVFQFKRMVLENVSILYPNATKRLFFRHKLYGKKWDNYNKKGVK